jgi:pimeloyl-ACP methyl ester carboxylesterase
MEKVVVFKNPNGNRLHGIVHIPDNSQEHLPRIGVNLLNPGLKNRVAPNRLNVKLARILCEHGYYVLRFDPSGIGDSEGDIEEGALIADIGQQVQEGLFVSDTLIANEYFVSEYKIDKLFLMGNCGGAVTSLLTSEQDERVKGLCLVDSPLKIRSSEMTFADKVAADGEKAHWYFSEYVKRLFRIKSWYRFLTFQTNYKAGWKVVKNKINTLFPKRKNETALSPNASNLCQAYSLSEPFFLAFEKFIDRNNPVLFIMAENFYDTEIFKKYFESIYLKTINVPDGLMDIYTVKDANHIYTLYEWQEALIHKVLEWLAEKN